MRPRVGNLGPIFSIFPMLSKYRERERELIFNKRDKNEERLNEKETIVKTIIWVNRLVTKHLSIQSTLKVQ
jgi:hypothetical protein